MGIKILDPSIVGRIAAGEVVERPSSVAKELIENSIDAGATAITVEIRGGGIDYLRVTDNGCGIEPGQVAIAFENHATSKLSSAEELDDIRTLGFRGEALPSIAAVAHVEMTTRRRAAQSGIKLQIDGGVKRPVAEVGCPEGTTVIVRELFYNVPVRRTFMKKANYEGSLVNDLVARMILGNPGVSFRFINNSKTVYHSFGDGNLKHAVFAVYGSETAEKMTELDAACGAMRIRGVIGVGELAKATRAHQAFYINGRTVRCALMTQALEQVCKGRVTIGTYPMCALTLTIPPASVDVNVHPNKLEVRFRDESSIRLSAENILSQAFAGETVLDLNKKEPEKVAQSIVVTHKPTGVVKEQTEISSSMADIEPKSVIAHQHEPHPVQPVMTMHEKSDAYIPTPEEMVRKLHTAEHIGDTGMHKSTHAAFRESADAPVAKSPESTAKTDIYRESLPQIRSEQAVAPPEKKRASLKTETHEQLTIESAAPGSQKPVYRVIGVLFNTYILVEVEDALLMIDQHAAHERLMYEKFTARMNSNLPAAQTLMTPVILSVSPREMALILDNTEELARAGYDVEPFGDNSISLRSVPFIMGSADARPAFMDMVGALERLSAAARETRADEIAVMACKAAVKAGDRLTDSEIEALISQMLSTGASPTCPHGRPVSRKLTRREIEKLFKRIQ